MADHGHDDLAGFLSNPASYPEGTSRVERRETHISLVYLTDEFVYKVKKPVKFDFLDFSTLEARERYCRRELRLNRRLAPDTYLDVLRITRRQGRLAWGGDGEAVEYCVQMRRLPQDRMLDHLVRTGQAHQGHVDSLLDLLCPFFEGAPTSDRISRAASPTALRSNVRANFKVLEGLPNHFLPSGVLPRIEAAQLGLLALDPELFEARMAGGFVRDCHGDLRAEHVCLLEPPVVFDCIEFNDRFRYNDVVSELCFLAVDLEELGSEDLSQYLLAGYQDRAGDRAQPELVGFYKSYRACVRAKVEGLRAAELDFAGTDEQSRRAAHLLELASRAVDGFYRPRVLVTMGLMGSGKTTVAHALAGELGMHVLSSDAVRKALTTANGTDAAYGAGIYAPEMAEQTYLEMFRRAEQLVGQGASVVLDATFKLRRHRGAVRDLAERAGADVLFVECVCPELEAISRLDRRRRTEQNLSDARPELYEHQRAEFEPTDELGPKERLVVDTRSEVPDLTRLILRALREVALTAHS
jgi:hypothetical protein